LLAKEVSPILLQLNLSGSGARERTEFLSNVRLFFEAHGESRFFPWDGGSEMIVNNQLGVYETA
jgi:hypothetical protein